MNSQKWIPFGIVLCLCVFTIRSSPSLTPIPTFTPVTTLTPQQIYEDLDQFQTELEGRFAYLKVIDARYKAAIRSIRTEAASGMTLDEFGLELQKVLALFIDCHSGISGYSTPEGSLPFQMEPVEGRVIAFWMDRSGFLDPAFPFITKIDGKSLAEWEQIIKLVLPKGSPQFVKTRVLYHLQSIQFARSLAGLKTSGDVSVELETEDGASRTELSLPVSPGTASSQVWPASQSHIMEGNIGYLRITGWGAAAFAEVADWMPRFPGTRGLIVDIRHNPGGTRNVLRELFPYFVSSSDQPHVAGAAKYKLYKDFGPDHLDYRNMHTQDWHGWTPAESTAIAEFMMTFDPEWDPPDGEFSGWHFWVVSKLSKLDAYTYNNPVIFLMDGKCFSASDVILSSVKGVRNITLIGTPSGGGSGAFITTTLKNSGLTLRLSSMASFQNTGSLFDSRGVLPDILMEPPPGYFLQGGPDPVLERAVQIILNTEPQNIKRSKIKR